MPRPKKEIDSKIFESLCKLQCTEAEICSFLEVSDKTLSAWCKRTYNESFSETYKKKSEGGKISLRRAQFRLAEKNAAMAIFLGKQYLGQSDNPEPAKGAQDDDGFLDALNGTAKEDWNTEGLDEEAEDTEL